MSTIPPTLRIRLPPGHEPNIDLSRYEGQRVTLCRDSATGHFSARLSCEEGIPSPDGLSFRRSVSLSDGGSFPKINNIKHVSTKRDRYLASVTLELGSISQVSPQSTNRSQRGIDGYDSMLLTHHGQGYTGYQDRGRINAKVVEATKLQDGLELPVTRFEHGGWQDLTVKLEESIFVEGTAVVDRQMSQEADGDSEMKKMVDTLVDG
jgi:hypothetical protein